MADLKIEKTINEDGTDFNPPKNPLMEKWMKLYPSSPKPEYSQVCDGYSCIWCGRCPRGEYWKVPEEDLEEYKKYLGTRDAYIAEHNPNFKERLEADLVAIFKSKDSEDSKIVIDSVPTKLRIL